MGAKRPSFSTFIHHIYNIMEIVIGITWIGTVIMCYYLGTCIDKLEDKINKQQKQIDELYQQNIRLVELTNHMTQASMDIATKVIDIEKRVDKQ